VFGSWYADCRNEPFEAGVARPDFKALPYVTFLSEFMGPSGDLAAVEKNTSGFDLESINVLFWVRAVIPLWWMRLFSSLYTGQPL